MSLFPYAYHMIETFNVTQDDSQVAIYAGMLITAFAFAEFSTGMIWGRISDRIGRKPVLIMGLVGTTLSMISFGFATNLPCAVAARALGGLLNGNVGVLQTTVAELVTVKEHQPRAYSIMPFVWCLGSIIGPAMGGALAMPCEAYPWLFVRGTVFDEFPFLLPNLVCVAVLVFGITIGTLFLEETHAELKYRHDPGLQLGGRLLSVLRASRTGACHGNKTERAPLDRVIYVTENESPPGYRSTEGSPRTSTASAAVSLLTTSNDAECGRNKANQGLAKTFNRQVVLVIIGYGILAL